MQVSETIENYLETILILLTKQKDVRSIDIVNEMGYSKPTISVMMKQLREKEFIEINDSGYITLTSTGYSIAKEVYERHVLLTNALIKLGVSEETALEDACKIEHVLSQETFYKIREHFNKHIIE